MEKTFVLEKEGSKVELLPFEFPVSLSVVYSEGRHPK